MPGHRRLADIGVRRWRVAPSPVDARLPNFSIVRVIPRTRLRPGVVVWAHVPFAECDEYKTRPAVVLHCDGRDVTLLPCTSAASRHRRPDRYIELKHPDAAGLNRATAVGLKPFIVDVLDLLDVIGELSAADRQRAFTASALSPRAAETIVGRLRVSRAPRDRT